MINLSFSHKNNNNTDSNDGNFSNANYQQEYNPEHSLLTVKRVINKSLLASETLITHVIGRLYISYESSPQFEYTNFEGIVCLVINRKTSMLLLQIYDLLDIKKEFEIELYGNIAQGYHVISETFHSIEYPTFFLGINFVTISFAELFKDSLKIHSLILDAEKNQFCFKEKANDTEMQIKIGLAEDLIQFHYNTHNGDLVYEISKEAIHYMERMGVEVTKMDSEYENVRGEMRFRKIEGRVNKSDFGEENYNKMISLMNDFAYNNNGEIKEKEEKEIDELLIINKVNKTFKTAKTEDKKTFHKETKEQLHQNNTSAEQESKKPNLPRRRTGNTDFNSIMMPKNKNSDLNMKHEKVLALRAQDVSESISK